MPTVSAIALFLQNQPRGDDISAATASENRKVATEFH
jgi:hypothetical protein